MPATARRRRPSRSETGIAVFQWDVGDHQACAEGVKRVEGEVGPVDILVNNAGITRDGWFHKMDYDAWSAVIRTNLDSMFAMTRPVIDGMRNRNFGRIVNISSINGQKGQIGQVNYSTAKGGLIGFTKALALENARKGITVNCVCPGYIDTDMVAAVSEKVMEGIVAAIPVEPAGQGGRDRRARRLSRVRHVRFHDRGGSLHQWRAIYGERLIRRIRGGDGRH